LPARPTNTRPAWGESTDDAVVAVVQAPAGCGRGRASRARQL